MKIPKDPVLRDHVYREIIDQCFDSSSERCGTYDRLKSYYLIGCDNEQTPIASKIYSALDSLVSYLFSAETTRFTVELGEGADRGEIPKAIPLRNRLMNEWHDSGTDISFGDTLKWSLTYNSMFLYPQWRRGGIQTAVLDPHNVGVYREDVAGLDLQEAFCWRYRTTRSQLLADLKDHPKLDQIMTRLASEAVSHTERLPPTVQRIITSQVNPNVIGQAAWMTSPTVDYQAKVRTDMVQMYELWLWDDDLGDWRRVTRSENDVTIWDRQNTYLPTKWNYKKTEIEARGEHPLVHLCPNRQYNYFWGRSEIAHLLNIQDAWAHRIQQMQRLGDKIVDPPKRGYGVNFDTMEAQDALFDPHGWVNMGEPNSKIDEEKITVPAELWHEVEFYDQLFADQMGITNIMKGLGEPGVRSRGQTDTMARLGSSRAKNRAMSIEDSLDQLATKILRLIQRHDTKIMRYHDQSGNEFKFTAGMFTNDFTVKVDGHTMSPIFVEDEKNMVFTMLENRMITRERALEMVHPVMLQTLLEDLKKIEAQEAQAAQQQMRAEQGGGGSEQRGSGGNAVVLEAIKQLTAAVAAPKRTELVKDAEGRAVAAISTPQLKAVK